MAIAILIGLLGFTVGTKMYQLFKILNIDVDHMSKEEIENLVKDESYFKMLDDPKFRKYMR